MNGIPKVYPDGIWHIGDEWFSLCECVHCEAMVVSSGFCSPPTPGTVVTPEMAEDFITSRIQVGLHSHEGFDDRIGHYWDDDFPVIGRNYWEQASTDGETLQRMIDTLDRIERELGFPPHLWPTVKVGHSV